MLGNNKRLMDANLVKQIYDLNDLIYGKTKHVFRINQPREQLLSLTESLLIYLASRQICITLLTQCGLHTKIQSELTKAQNGLVGIFIGQSWLIDLSYPPPNPAPSSASSISARACAAAGWAKNRWTLFQGCAAKRKSGSRGSR